MLRALIATLAIATALAAACGSPSGDDAPFTYDPIPYTVVIERGTPVAIASERDNGYQFRADALTVMVAPDRTDKLMEWAKRYDFEFGHVIEDRRFGVTIVELIVPAGSVKDALELVRRQDVLAADLAHYGKIPEQ